MTIDIGSRPEKTAADRALDKLTQQPVGSEETGTIFFVEPNLGSGFVKDNKTGCSVPFNRNGIGLQDFNKIAGQFALSGQKTEVQYRLNAFNVIVAIQLIP